jgi:hypothetical protein
MILTRLCACAHVDAEEEHDGVTPASGPRGSWATGLVSVSRCAHALSVF